MTHCNYNIKTLSKISNIIILVKQDILEKKLHFKNRLSEEKKCVVRCITEYVSVELKSHGPLYPV